MPDPTRPRPAVEWPRVVMNNQQTRRAEYSEETAFFGTEALEDDGRRPEWQDIEPLLHGLRAPDEAVSARVLMAATLTQRLQEQSIESRAGFWVLYGPAIFERMLDQLDEIGQQNPDAEETVVLSRAAHAAVAEALLSIERTHDEDAQRRHADIVAGRTPQDLRMSLPAALRIVAPAIGTEAGVDGSPLARLLDHASSPVAAAMGLDAIAGRVFRAWGFGAPPQARSIIAEYAAKLPKIDDTALLDRDNAREALRNMLGGQPRQPATTALDAPPPTQAEDLLGSMWLPHAGDLGDAFVQAYDRRPPVAGQPLDTRQLRRLFIDGCAGDGTSPTPARLGEVSSLLGATARLPVGRQVDVLLDPPVIEGLAGLVARAAAAPGRAGGENALDFARLAGAALHQPMAHAADHGRGDRVVAALERIDAAGQAAVAGTPSHHFAGALRSFQPLRNGEPRNADQFTALTRPPLVMQTAARALEQAGLQTQGMQQEDARGRPGPVAFQFEDGNVVMRAAAPAAPEPPGGRGLQR